MDKAEFLEKIKNIGTCEDDVTRRTMLTELQDDVSNVFDTNENLTKENNDLKGDNNRLYDENMKLFLRVSDDKEPDDEPKPPKEKRKFEDLFNDKGGIK